jgi:hypothetical protein
MARQNVASMPVPDEVAAGLESQIDEAARLLGAVCSN